MYPSPYADDRSTIEQSWCKKWFCKFKKATTSKEAREAGRKIARGAELAGLEKPQADINKAQAEALSNLMAIAKEFRNAAIQCGTTLLVVTSDKGGDKSVVAVTLTAVQIIALENNQQLLYSPATLLAELRRICDGKVNTDSRIVAHD